MQHCNSFQHIRIISSHFFYCSLSTFDKNKIKKKVNNVVELANGQLYKTVLKLKQIWKLFIVSWLHFYLQYFLDFISICSKARCINADWTNMRVLFPKAVPNQKSIWRGFSVHSKICRCLTAKGECVSCERVLWVCEFADLNGWNLIWLMRLFMHPWKLH